MYCNVYISKRSSDFIDNIFNLGLYISQNYFELSNISKGQQFRKIHVDIKHEC